MHVSTTILNNLLKNKFLFLTVAPHIGHLYSSVIADAIARWQHLLNPAKQICFASGTDEHGSKIQQAALKNNKSLPEYCSEISDKYKLMSSKFNIAYTDFIRTTEKRHIDAVHVMWVGIYLFENYLHAGKSKQLSHFFLKLLLLAPSNMDVGFISNFYYRLLLVLSRIKWSFAL